MTQAQALALVLFALGAFAIPLVSRRVGLPAAVGELLFGVLVGPSVAGWLVPSELSSLLAQLGLAFLMFLAGLELDFRRLERQGARPLALGAAVPVLLFGLALVATWLLDLPIFLLLVLGAVSIGVLLTVVRELGLTRSPVGQTAIFVGSLAEALTIVLLTTFDAYERTGFGLGLLAQMSKLGLVLVVGYLLLVVLRTAIWWRPGIAGRLLVVHDPAEIGVRAGMALMLAFVALATLLDVEPILGAFVAGALVAFVVRDKQVLEGKLSSVGFGFFVPLFFISVGAEFQLELVMRGSILGTVGLLLAAALACKLGACLPLLGLGLRVREVVAVSLLFSAPLTLLVVIAQVGQHSHVIEEPMAAAIVLLAIVSSTVAPLVCRLLLRGSARAAQQPPAAGGGATSPA